jgi:Zn-dependent peptidase ImmA (M78 family)
LTFRHITFQENQAAANRLLKSYGYEDTSGIPIDPERIIRRMRLGPVPFANLRKNFGIKGMVTKYGEKVQIWIDEYHYENEPESSMFTLGEELGHCVLHLEECGEIKSVEQWMRIMHRDRDQNKFIHAQAKLFASNILLPAFVFDSYAMEWVCKNLKDIVRFAGISPGELASTIAFLMEDDLGLSQQIIEHTLTRWPNQAIKQIREGFPELRQL